jgi:hypothetical protein
MSHADSTPKQKQPEAKEKEEEEWKKDIGIIKCINRQHGNQMGQHFFAVQNQCDFEYNNITALRKQTAWCHHNM